MGEITDRLPAPQYDSAPFKRANSHPNNLLESMEPSPNKKALFAQANKPRPAAPLTGARNDDTSKPVMTNLSMSNN